MMWLCAYSKETQAISVGQPNGYQTNSVGTGNPLTGGESSYQWQEIPWEWKLIVWVISADFGLIIVIFGLIFCLFLPLKLISRYVLLTFHCCSLE